MIRKEILVLGLVIALVTFALMHVYFYKGTYTPPVTGVHDYNITVETVERQARPTGLPEISGVVAIDVGHDNEFTENEIASLLTALDTRNQKIEFTRDLGDSLRKARSLVVISPRSSYKDSEIELINQFLGKGGRLLLLTDADRESEINSISSKLGVRFYDDYVYDQSGGEGNFKYIALKRFSSPLEEVNTATLYSACSIDAETRIASADVAARSSSRFRAEPYVLIGGARNGSVIALCDQTFMLGEYVSTAGNWGLVSSIATFLSSANRSFLLEDYPHFLGDNVTVVATNKTLSSSAIELKNSLKTTERRVTISDGIKGDSAVVLASFEHTLAKEYLTKIKINSTNDSITIDGVDFEKNMSALVGYDKESRVVYVLSDSEKAIDTALSALKAGTISSFLIKDDLAYVK